MASLFIYLFLNSISILFGLEKNTKCDTWNNDLKRPASSENKTRDQKTKQT
jgi:hypothetical protein